MVAVACRQAVQIQGLGDVSQTDPPFQRSALPEQADYHPAPGRRRRGRSGDVAV